MKNWPISNQGGLVSLFPSASGLEASQCARIIGPCSGRTQLARFQIWLCSSEVSIDHIVQNQPGSNWFWLTGSGFGQTDLVWEKTGVQVTQCVCVCVCVCMHACVCMCACVCMRHSIFMANATEPVWIGCELNPSYLLC